MGFSAEYALKVLSDIPDCDWEEITRVHNPEGQNPLAFKNLAHIRSLTPKIADAFTIPLIEVPKHLSTCKNLNILDQMRQTIFRWRLAVGFQLTTDRDVLDQISGEGWRVVEEILSGTHLIKPLIYDNPDLSSAVARAFSMPIEEAPKHLNTFGGIGSIEDDITQAVLRYRLSKGDHGE